VRGFNTRKEIALAEAWRRMFSTVVRLRPFANASIEEAFVNLAAERRYGLSDLMTRVVVVTDMASSKEIAR
jgi:hypothetical protein